jgi:hypothetical protein
MNILMRTNIDDIRTEIMRLESAPTFDLTAWSKVLADMNDRPAGLADAKRRMETAMLNKPMRVCTDLGMGGDEIGLELIPVVALPWESESLDVSAETEPTYARE